MAAAPPSLNDPVAARLADAAWLSVALMDARNRILRWLECFEVAGRVQGGPQWAQPPWRMVGWAGWQQEHAVARHVQRLRGEDADPGSMRLPSVEPRADAWFGPLAGAPGAESAPPDGQELRHYLATTLETTLELLATASPTDGALHAFRLALQREDRLAEKLASAAQWLGVSPAADGSLGRGAPARTPREPMWVPDGRILPGSAGPGFVPLNERGGQWEPVPGFEIDAQAVSWARYAEFVEDGGYDEPGWWSAAGWRWAQAAARRAPRGVEQMRQGIALERFGRVVRVAGTEACAHVSWYEAEAWCRWAGRRLPTELEWERAVSSASARGFVWGDVREWAAGRARLWPLAAGVAVSGFLPPDPARGERVLRGASSWTAPRDVQPRGRCFIDPERDEGFFGFRSCAA
ncbi:MAG: SUMF1/EgtB/PvdO family nonheme iron enzyme [Rubrivivax sp.]